MLAINHENSPYEEMNLKMRKREGSSARVAKSVSLSEEFPPPPSMSLLTCNNLFALQRCSRFQHSGIHLVDHLEGLKDIPINNQIVDPSDDHSSRLCLNRLKKEKLPRTAPSTVIVSVQSYRDSA